MESNKNFDVVNTNQIIFDRIDDSNIKGYDIKVIEVNDSGEEFRYTLATIINPKIGSPIKTIEKVKYSSNKRYKLNKTKVYYDTVYRINVYINSQKLNPIFINFNPESKTVFIEYNNIQIDDIIEIEYYFDGITYEHITNNSCEYYVDMIIENSNSIGNHNLLL